MARKGPEELWQTLLSRHHPTKLAWLPRSPRCALCGVPFEGFGGALSRLVGYRRWNKNPTLCNLCFTHLPEGGIETDVAIMFADFRGSTSLAERMDPSDFAALLNRFYERAIEVLAPHRAIIDKMIGDEVMAFFTRMGSRNHHLSAVRAAIELMRRFREVLPNETVPRLGIGLNSGMAFVGKVGTGEVQDFTALGDTINVAARLQAEAKAGEIVMSDELYQSVAAHLPEIREHRTVLLKGREQPVTIWVLQYVAG